MASCVILLDMYVSLLGCIHPAMAIKGDGVYKVVGVCLEWCKRVCFVPLRARTQLCSLSRFVYVWRKISLSVSLLCLIDLSTLFRSRFREAALWVWLVMGCYGVWISPHPDRIHLATSAPPPWLTYILNSVCASYFSGYELASFNGGGSDCTGGSADLLPLSTFTL